ncbi:hypothetical protein ACA910_005400 [Epithemia clementina (nom. ined.)]
MLSSLGAPHPILLQVPPDVYQQQPHELFVNVQDVIPGMAVDVRYVSHDNFVGTVISGYQAAKILLTRPAAEALIPVESQLRTMGLGLLIYDGYRPQRAVNQFVEWALKDANDTRTKHDYYPNIVDKAHLVRDGYIAARSGHSRGSTVDLTIMDRTRDGDDSSASPKQPPLHYQTLDMGTPFDWFDPRSWPSSTNNVSATQRAHRLLLRTLMVQAGFRPLDEEWWHFTLIDEPFPNTYFDFVIIE